MELIVVLSIFAIMTSIVIFNYNKFLDDTNIKVLASDVALQVVTAQKSAIDGELQSAPFTSNDPTVVPSPAYGVYFNTSSLANSENFVYFADMNNDGACEDGSGGCSVIGPASEVLNTIGITNGNYISKIEITDNNNNSCPVNNLTVVFKRPDTSARISTTTPIAPCSSIASATITISAPDPSVVSNIEIYPSGRIQID